MHANVKVFLGNVVIDYISQRKNLRLSTGVTKVLPEQLENGALTAAVEDYKRKNKTIAAKLLQIDKIIDDYFISEKEKPSIQYIKDMLKKPISSVKIGEEEKLVEKADSLQTIYQEFYKSKQGDAIVRASLKDYNSTFNTLVAFHKLKHKISLNEINSPDFLRMFEKFCSEPISKEQREKLKLEILGSMNDNTIKKRISVLKTFMKWCYEKKFIAENRIAFYVSKIRAFQPTVVILTKEEQDALEAKNLSGQDEQLRDIMLFLCKTGIRYSDLLTLTKDDVHTGYIVKEADKTRLKFKVPISPKAKLLLEKYNNNFNIFSTTMFNRLIKELLEREKICDYIINIRAVSYVAIERTQVKKYTEISSHTGRRSFIAHCIINGISLPEIMSYTGHRKVTSLQVYVDLFQIQKDSAEKIKALD